MSKSNKAHSRMPSRVKDEEKECRTCKIWKEFSSFCKDKKSPDGLNSRCRDCEREYRRELRLRKKKNTKPSSLLLSKKASLAICSVLEAYYGFEQKEEGPDASFWDVFSSLQAAA
ncbi:Hypothetical protein BQ3484_496 [Cedratvirus A11]|uniref:Uncharacterized protein n=1 Tax=Cedratvirus A11 TaxID=1903266 RepID=A0A1M7XV23_9VIRU|nr:endonuclease VII [Cedratvirus A11]SHO33564.1 Hypothetical protein BQ3484_496 [Cedratvirus A11]